MPTAAAGCTTTVLLHTLCVTASASAGPSSVGSIGSADYTTSAGGSSTSSLATVSYTSSKGSSDSCNILLPNTSCNTGSRTQTGTAGCTTVKATIRHLTGLSWSHSTKACWGSGLDGDLAGLALELSGDLENEVMTTLSNS